ncbi:hypothetical protein BDN70DRAFT_528534 [Pholiota conissans]|uniref:Uncharacterized protein n=1 Tax=Pholiota conissans TaxID=109636 RepID=A0A9P6D3B2_9AGAR|nr:hypothetical protein BDN70DRAFT_528534 [Pholiota conissans]
MPPRHSRNSAQNNIASMDVVEMGVDRLSKMYIQAELCAQKARSQYTMDQLPEFKVRYQAVLDAFHRDKVTNPTEFPTTPEESAVFLQKCDNLCLLNPQELTLDECLNTFCGLVYGSQFVSSTFLNDEQNATVMKRASDRCTQTFQPHESTPLQGTVPVPALLDQIYVGMEVALKDIGSDTHRQYTLIDQGYSVMNGNYWSFQENEGIAPVILKSEDILERFVQL